MKSVVIIGGGITGLTTLYELHKQIQKTGAQATLALVEENPEAGGKLRTVRKEGFIMETGADSIVARKKGVAGFLKELGLENQIRHNATGISYLYREDGLKPIPAEAVFGIPASLDALFGSELVSTKGKLAALKDLFTKNQSFTKDSSAGEFLEAFFGKELVKKQIAPVLSGVYSGNLYELTLATTMPFLVDYKNQYGSIMKGLSEHKQTFLSPEKKKFVSFKNGLAELAGRLEEKAAGADIIKGVKADVLERHEKGYTVVLSDGRRLEADVVVLAVPHAAAKKLLADPALDEEWGQFKAASVITVYLGFDVPDAVLPKDGTGFIVSGGSGLACNACTWTSRKWPHTSKNGRLLLRLFYKDADAALFNRLNAMDQEGLIETALKDVRQALGISAQPVAAEVTKWLGKMPKYDLHHRQRVEALTKKLSASDPDVVLAGCSYYGVGIADCIVNGKETAGKVMEKLREQGSLNV